MSPLLAFGAVLFASLVRAQSGSVSIPPQSAYTPPPSAVGNAALPPVSYTYVYTVTTATTAWQAPTFQTSVPGPAAACSDTMCPDLDGKTCTDSMGNSYGVLCDTRFIGNVITTSGKRDLVGGGKEEGRDLEEASLLGSKREAVAVAVADAEAEAEGDINARTFTRTFDGCADACDMVQGCVGMSFNAGFAGNCQSLSVVEGSFEAVGEVAAVKQ